MTQNSERSLSLPFIVLYFHLNERANLIDDFNNNKELICNMGSLKIDVSKADNWSVDKNSFLKVQLIFQLQNVK
ncbi:hypothetical protein ACOAK2_11770 (plasmid) [Aliarcobacter butzleri]|uniref:hypothetical protein n=1 Tax=Aliarcobacter butzleri TaxID=28197 RepID=UPI003B286FFF